MSVETVSNLSKFQITASPRTDWPLQEQYSSTPKHINPVHGNFNVCWNVWKPQRFKSRHHLDSRDTVRSTSEIPAATKTLTLKTANLLFVETFETLLTHDLTSDSVVIIVMCLFSIWLIRVCKLEPGRICYCVKRQWNKETYTRLKKLKTKHSVSWVRERTTPPRLTIKFMLALVSTVIVGS
jgi:hypothetical protein